MLNDVRQVPVHTTPSHPERSVDAKGQAGSRTERSGPSPSLRDRPGSSAKGLDRPSSGASNGSEALEFRREESSMHRLYRSTRETVEMSRGEKIEELRQAVKNGTYRPNLMVVAERVLSSGELGRF